MTGRRRCRAIRTRSSTPRSARLSSSPTRCAFRATSCRTPSCAPAGPAWATTPIPTSSRPCTDPGRRGAVSVTAASGQPYATLVGTKWQRDDQGHIVVDSASGLPVRDSKQVALGNYNADWVGGITNTFTYKNLSLSFSFDGQMGGNVYSVTKWFGQYSGVLQATLQGREQDWNDMFVVPNAVYQSGSGAFLPDTVHVLAQDYWHKIGRASCRG